MEDSKEMEVMEASTGQRMDLTHKVVSGGRASRSEARVSRSEEETVALGARPFRKVTDMGCFDVHLFLLLLSFFLVVIFSLLPLQHLVQLQEQVVLDE